MGKRLIREPVVLERLACGRTKLHEDYVKTGRLRWVYLGPRNKAAVEDEVDALVVELIAERDAATTIKRERPGTPRKAKQRAHAET